MTKPKLFDEAIHFRAREGTKARIDALRGAVRQGDFIRELLEEALAAREELAKLHDTDVRAESKAGAKRALSATTGVAAGVNQEGNQRVATIRAVFVSAKGKPGKQR